MQLVYTKQLDVTYRPDVLICGAGCAGIGAAVAAGPGGGEDDGRRAVRFPGGFFAANIGSAFDGFTDQLTGEPVVGGVVFEMLERMGVLQGRDPARRPLHRKSAR